MNHTDFGLFLNFLGAILLCISSQIGVGVGWGGPVVWKKAYWRWINLFGWILFIIGFMIQFQPFVNCVLRIIDI